MAKCFWSAGSSPEGFTLAVLVLPGAVHLTAISPRGVLQKRSLCGTGVWMCCHKSGQYRWAPAKILTATFAPCPIGSIVCPPRTWALSPSRVLFAFVLLNGSATLFGAEVMRIQVKPLTRWERRVGAACCSAVHTSGVCVPATPTRRALGDHHSAGTCTQPARCRSVWKWPGSGRHLPACPGAVPVLSPASPVPFSSPR